MPQIEIHLKGEVLSDKMISMYQVKAADVGTDLSFSCVWKQVVPGHEVLYSGVETSDLVKIFLPPAVDKNMKQRLTFLFNKSS